MNLVKKIKNGFFPVIAGTMIAGGLFFGFKGDHYKYTEVKKVFPKVEIGYMGYAINLKKLPLTKKNKIENLYFKAHENYSLGLLLGISGIAWGISYKLGKN